MESRTPPQVVASTSARPVAGTLWIATAAFWARHALTLIDRLRRRQADSPQSAPRAVRATGSGDGS